MIFRKILLVVFIFLIFITSKLFVTNSVFAASNLDIQNQVDKFCTHISNNSTVFSYLCSLKDVVANLQTQISNLQNEVTFYKSCHGNYTTNEDGTVTDNCKGLIWQQISTDAIFNFNDATNYCHNLTLASKSDWRLPTMDELITLLNFNTFGSHTYPNFVFGTNPNSSITTWLWSSTPSLPNYGKVWVVVFETGVTGNFIPDSVLAVRCVRNNY